MNIVHTGLNIAPELELVTAFVDLNSAQFASPIVDVPEEMAVDCAKVLQVEISRRHPFPCPLGHKTTLDPIQKPSIDNSETVSEDIGAGIDVWIFSCRHLDAARACSRM